MEKSIDMYIPIDPDTEATCQKLLDDGKHGGWSLTPSPYDPAE